MKQLADLSYGKKHYALMMVVIKRYDVNGESVRIYCDDETVIATPQEVCDLADTDKERIVNNLRNCIKLNVDNYSRALNAYKEMPVDTLPTEMTCLKLYQKDRPDDVEGANIGRTWADYEGQMELHPEYIVCNSTIGMWATEITPEMVAAMCNPICLGRYGSSFILLSPCAEEEYIIGEEGGVKEIVGHKFNVIMRGSLYCQEDWKSLEQYVNRKAIIECGVSDTKIANAIRESLRPEHYEKELCSMNDIVGLMDTCAAGLNWKSADMAYTPEAKKAAEKIVHDLCELRPNFGDDEFHLRKIRENHLPKIDGNIVGLDEIYTAKYILENWDEFKISTWTFRYLSVIGRNLIIQNGEDYRV